MSKKATLIIAGVVTSVVMVLVLGLAGGASWFSPVTSAADSQTATTSTAAASDAVCVNPQDAAALQAQLNDYQAALQQANTQLQAAYNEIAQLQAQGRFSGEHEEHEGTFFNPFGNN